MRQRRTTKQAAPKAAGGKGRDNQAHTSGILTAASNEVEVITRSTVHTPYVEGEPGYTVTFAPDYVACDVVRRFFIELKMPRKGMRKLDVRYDHGCMRLLDWKEFETEFSPTSQKVPKRVVHRYYFETCGRSPMTKIRFMDGESAVVVPLVVWDFNDLRTFRRVNKQKLPRRFPVHSSFTFVKEKQTYPTVRKKGGRKHLLNYDRGRTRFNEEIDTYGFTLEEAWKICLDSSAFGLDLGQTVPDPVHGDAIYKYGAFWSFTKVLPTPGHVDSWYVLSPIDGRKIPDNDLAQGDYSSGKYIDDGFNGLEYNGVRHHFAGQVASWRGNMAKLVTLNTAENYLETSDPHYLHLCLVTLSRLAVEFSYLAAMPQSRRANAFVGKNLRLVDATPVSRVGNAGFIQNGIATSAHIGRCFTAYDKIFPYIEEDQEIVPFLQAKGLPIRNHKDLKRLIEEGIFLTWMQIAMDGTCHVNYPGTETAFLTAVDILNYPTTKMIDVAYQGSPGYWSSGFVYQCIGNGLYRDGMKFESPGGYNGHGNIKVLNFLQDKLPRILKRHPALFPADKYPVPGISKRFITAAETHIEHSPLPTTRITIGDAGALPVFGNPAGIKTTKDLTKRPKPLKYFFGDENAEFFEDVYKKYRTPKVAWALVNSQQWKPSKDFPYTRAELRNKAAELPANWRSRGRLLSGEDLSILRSGSGANERCLVTHYGKRITHAGQTQGSFHLDAFGNKLVTQWGYPQGWHRWYYSWVTQNAGRSYPLCPQPDTYLWGYNDLNVDAGNIHISDSVVRVIRDRKKDLRTSREPTGSRYENMPVDDGWQRRVFALVDVDAESFYVLDAFRMLGGNEHWRSFSSLDGKCEVAGIRLTPREGVLAGEHAIYNDPKAVKDVRKAPFYMLYNVRNGKAQVDGKWSATWHINNSNGLKLRLMGLASDGAEINLCDAKEPNDSHPVVRHYIMWHHKPNVRPVRSQVLNLYDVYRDKPVIAAAEALPVTGSDEHGFAPYGCSVQLKNGRRDFFIISADRNGTKSMKLPNGKTLELQGRMGYVALDKAGKVVDMALIEGTSLTCDGRKLINNQAVYTAKIESVDYENWVITARPGCSAPVDLLGRHIYVLRGNQRIPMEVRAVQEEGDRLQITVNATPKMFTTPILRAEGRWLLMREKPSFSLTVRLSANKYYYGATVIGRNGKRYKVDTVTPDGIRLQNADIDEAELQAAFPERTIVDVYDYAPGDGIEIPLTVSR